MQFPSREHPYHPPIVCYNVENLPPVNTELLDRLAAGQHELVKELIIPPKDGLAWEVKAGQLFRIVCTEGPQVADVNFWSLQNPKERFYASKTRQLHASHLKKHDRWEFAATAAVETPFIQFSTVSIIHLLIPEKAFGKSATQHGASGALSNICYSYKKLPHVSSNLLGIPGIVCSSLRGPAKPACWFQAVVMLPLHAAIGNHHL